MEVLYAITEARGYSVERLENVRVEKADKRAGFKNISTSVIEDIDSNSNNYVYEVESIKFGKYSFMNENDVIKDNVKINISYHTKRKIVLPISVNQLHKRNYYDVVDYFQQLGFSNIQKFEIPDLKNGWIKKENSVEYISINGKLNVRKGIQLYYDDKIVIGYHTFK